MGFGIGGDLRQHEALVTSPGADRVQRRLAAGSIERAAQNLAVDGDNALNGFGELRHEPLEHDAELLSVKQAE
jgi:hypothetical protein